MAQFRNSEVFVVLCCTAGIVSFCIREYQQVKQFVSCNQIIVIKTR
jgi:hypothetical protein